MRFGTAFMAIWAALAIATGVMQVFASPKVRREFWIPIQVIAGMALVTAAVLMDGSRTMIFFAAFGAFALILNAVTTRICLSCGMTNRNTAMFPVPKFCQKCGHDLDAPEATRS